MRRVTPHTKSCKQQQAQPWPSCAGEGNVNGFGLEFYIETPSDEIPDSLDDIKRYWQFQLLYTVSQLAAGTQLGEHVQQQQ